ncbi:tail completion protein gp17 [Hydrocarboniphaga effusa]|uniref:tail completion protein gp17 n=1 Tax=Hydrocarboniphaga effusa TaxID=243629 RepID=UPI003BAB7D1B
MRPNLYPMVQGDAGVQAILGDDPMRFFPFGEADEGSNPDQVYATWQLISGLPQNQLKGPATLDWFRMQIDVWAANANDADAAASALRTALEPKGYIVSINADGRDPATRAYRISFDFEFWQKR